ncbi:MAG: sporulation initiation factor Spo0A C-terminal domain-containing protein [Lachnospiraceae bacterium]|jgi:two-component system response regulator (stage 0 sporulation protein A)|nr:sporulation initiation factor Spo0A C-terminal domain-containing protein [Lachnospiraceae bacterium]
MDISLVKDFELERYITTIMLDMGVPAHLRGYHYLRDAILISGKNMDFVCNATKLLYPVVAKHFRTTDQKVERAIRNAIEVSWARGNRGTLMELFGSGGQIHSRRPTNSEYIARVADKVRLDVKAIQDTADL